jgi:hypothetical protein
MNKEVLVIVNSQAGTPLIDVHCLFKLFLIISYEQCIKCCLYTCFAFYTTYVL